MAGGELQLMYGTRVNGPYIAHHTLVNGVWICNGVPVSKSEYKKAYAKASPEERQKMNEATKKARLKKELREHPERLYKHRDDLSKEEIDAIVSQVKWDSSIKSVSDEAHKKNIAKVISIASNAASLTQSAYNTYNNVRNLMGLFEERRKNSIAADIRKDPSLAKKYEMDFTKSEMQRILDGESWKSSGGDGGGKGKKPGK